MIAPLLATKLYIPSLRPGFIPRPRLIERLNEGLHLGHRLTLISAPAGYGKTTLVAEWLRGLQRPVAWLSLDENDDDPVRFLAYVVAALQRVGDTIGQDVWGALQSPQLPPIESLMTALINDITAQPATFVLVLDDYYLINELAVHEAMGFLLRQQPSQMYLVIVTREDPPLPLPRLRARGQMTELRASDLRFTEAEAVAFLNRAMGLNLTSEEVTALEAKTEGWIAGLQLAALSLQKEADRPEFIRRFAGDDRHVMDYLVDEVLARQSEAVQHFLLRTSVLERLCGPLCDAVTGGSDSQAILGHLERANLFVIPLDNRRYWYRYHHLFAELLRRRLRQSPPFIAPASGGERGRVETLHLRASRWYRREGFIAEAVSHALASSDLEYATELIARYAGVMWNRSETVLVHNWLEALPEEAIRSNPFLCIRRAWVAVAGSSEPIGSTVVEVVEQWLQDAERAWAARSSDADELACNTFFGDVAAVRAFLSLRRGDDPKEVIEFAHQVLDRIPEGALGPRTALFLLLGRAYRALGNEQAALQSFAGAREIGEAGGSLYAALSAICGQVMMTCLHGQFRQAAEICRDALRSIAEPFGQAGQPLPAAGPIYILLGTILVEWGDLEEAEHTLSRGIELAKLVRAADPYHQMGYESLIRIKRHQGDMAGALGLAQQVERLGPEAGSLAAAFQARVWLAQAEHDPRFLVAAAQWAEERQVELDLKGRYSVEQLTLARLLIAQHRAHRQLDLQPLLESLDRQLQAAEEREYVWWMIEALILKAMALQAKGDTDRALSTLHRALALAEPEGFVLLFVDEGAPMARLLYQAVGRGAAPEYAGRLLAAFPAAEPVPTDLPTSQDIEAKMVEPLSKRELEVLGVIAEGLTNREIAQRLFISPKTVKRHTSSIYGKLGVHSRTRAVAKARSLGILPLDRA